MDITFENGEAIVQPTDGGAVALVVALEVIPPNTYSIGIHTGIHPDSQPDVLRQIAAMCREEATKIERGGSVS